MVIYPNAKINLGLAVTQKREDGYHDLDTHFIPVPGLHDIITIRRAKEFTFLLDGIQLDCTPEDNIIVRAYRQLKKLYPRRVKPVSICVTKCIPFGAGLGGGSSDAAFTVKALNEMFHLHLTNEQMEAVVAPLGADCPFFIQNTPRRAQGIGNIFKAPNEEFIEAIRYKYIVIVKPNCTVNTAAAYKGIIPRNQLPPHSRHHRWHNDFEDTIFPQFPEIEAVKNNLIKCGAFFASMSGSGAAVFGLFKDKKSAANATASEAFENCFAHFEQIHID